jgi:hypothetical protein
VSLGSNKSPGGSAADSPATPAREETKDLLFIQTV